MLIALAARVFTQGTCVHRLEINFIVFQVTRTYLFGSSSGEVLKENHETGLNLSSFSSNSRCNSFPAVMSLAKDSLVKETFYRMYSVLVIKFQLFHSNTRAFSAC